MAEASVYDSYFLFSTNEKFFIEPRNVDGSSVGHECLTIDRVSREIVIESNRNIAADAVSRTIFGVIGVIRLIAGNYLLVITSRVKVGEIRGHVIWQVTGTDIIPYVRTTLHLNEVQVQDNKTYLGMVSHVLATESYYYSTTYDLTHSFQRLQNTSPEFRLMALHERAEERFVWNFHVLRELALRPDLSKYTLPLLHGFVGIRQCTINAHPFKLILVSRRSCYRAGVRFHTRGVDNQGHVANYVETEQIVEYGSFKCSFVQTRGSIPLYWSQSPNLRWQPWPTIPSDGQKLGFVSHMESQSFNYGKQVIVNLVNRKGREKQIGETLGAIVQDSGLKDVKYVHYDFHKEVKAMNFDRLSGLVDQLLPDLEHFGFFSARDDGYAHKQQVGVFRTNCIDCLDRTNVVQSLLAKRSLEYQLKYLQVMKNDDVMTELTEFETIFKNLWADNGDFCSSQYAGTGALKADFTRTGKRTKLGMLRDLTNALIRYYKNNFVDGFRQDAIDLFLGNYVVDEQNITSPIRTEWDWRFAAVPLGFVMALSMFFLCITFETELFFTLFWLVGALALLGFIFAYGEEFVNKPKLKLD